ncbi:class III lanthionine synthetase LanKC [Streptomyces sp. NPDC006632]|uniref:class III lanthionine synthetase LanKC n=1 Tax=Streptomyces sp. NPDC006632 TaxID=3157182 RepID=UPI0033A6E59D
MDKRYEVFCLADRYFYETPDRLSSSRTGARVPLFELAERPAPQGWTSQLSGDWLHFNPDGIPGRRPMPQQGWKIHISACLGNAEKIAQIVWDYCVPRAVPFKFVPGRRPLHLRNSKYAGRGSSGKFVTIYPADDAQFQLILEELGALLEGEPGPYVLSDLRWGQGPLYVRYGGFTKRHCVDRNGVLVTAIENADGVLVPDRRDPVFHLPEWVALPEFLAPHLAARNATGTGDLPYRIERALHFSNGGGVYAGTDTRTGEKVVLKEARPYAGLAADGADAVARLEQERAALEQVAGSGVAPAVRDWFTLGEHRFLVMDFLEGRSLNSFFAYRHPLIGADPDPEAIAEYTRWALRIVAATEDAVAAVHECGIVFNDLHMFNIMVDPDEQGVRLLDFEAALPVDDHIGQAMAHPGFIAPLDRKGFDVDRYALACLRIALFVPMTSLLVIDRAKAAHLAEIAASQFPGLPAGYLDEAVRVIEGEPAPDAGRAPAAPGHGRVRFEPGDWPASRDSMARAILASATPERDDRLFPGDIAQFATGGGLGLAHGAAGVLYALAETGAARYPEGEQWLLAHTAPPPSGSPLGLYDGLAGAAYVLDRLGHTERARELIETVLAEKWQRLAPELHGGLAGLGLVLDQLGFKEQALEVADVLAERAGEGRRAGLLHGAAGPALFCLRLYESTGDPALLDRAAEELRRDLDRCVVNPSGTLVVNDTTRTLPYLGGGSVGIAAVLDDFLAHRPDEAFRTAREQILPAARSRYYAQSGLFNGRAGMVLHLARTGAPREWTDEQIRGLGWFALPYEGHLAFPGDQLMRLSMDLGTGTAGCLLALGAALADRPVGLPFLAPLPAAPPGGPTNGPIRG